MKACPAIISLGQQLPAGSCSLPRAERAALSPLLGLAPGGGCLAARITANAGELLPHLFTLTSSPASLPVGEGSGGSGLFLWPDPVDYSTPGVARRRALWSADFPLKLRFIQSHQRSPDQPGLSIYTIFHEKSSLNQKTGA